MALASGTAAVHYAIITLAKSGDEIVSANNLYGGTYTMFDAIQPQFGIVTRCREGYRAEDPGRVPREHGQSRARRAGHRGDRPHRPRAPAALIVDGTFTTPYLLRSIDLGADIVVNSLTKWMGGHGTAIGGILTDSGRFDWKDPKFSLFNEPDPNYHGLRWAQTCPPPSRR